MPASVASNKVVSIHYTLTNDDGDVLDSSSGGEPLAYLHGAGNIVPGLERQIEGKSVGDKFDAVVPPSEGYGERTGPAPQAISRDAFGDVEVEPGMSFVIEDDDGNQTPLWIVDVEEEHVYVDANHPLAGETLHFAVEVIEIRDATAAELAHGHVHGDGHDHHH